MSSNRLFGTFCLSSYLLSLSYGTTFLLAMTLRAHGASEADAGSVISMAYFIGVFGFPLLAGKVIVEAGMAALLQLLLLVIALANWSITVARLAWRRRRAVAVA